MAFKGSEGLRDCHRRLIDRYIDGGMVDLFGRTLKQINLRPPKDMRKYFQQFLGEAKRVPIPPSILAELTAKFGEGVEFWRGFGILMIVFGGKKAYGFAVASRILAKCQDRPNKQNHVQSDRRPTRQDVPKLITTEYGDVPRTSKIFLAALVGQSPHLPSRSVPNGPIR